MRCAIVEKHNLLILCLNDAKNESISKLEIHSFKYLGNLNDSCYHAHFNNLLKAESLGKDEMFENLEIQQENNDNCFYKTCLNISSNFCGSKNTEKSGKGYKAIKKEEERMPLEN